MAVKVPAIYNSLQNAVSRYISKIEEKHPKLSHQIMSCLLSAPKAKAQEYLHVDYKPHTWTKHPDEQPVSAIIAVESFSLDIVASEDKKELETVTVHPGNMIIFTNKCIHRGGKNVKKEYVCCV
jgi:hypothetical protein